MSTYSASMAETRVADMCQARRDRPARQPHRVLDMLASGMTEDDILSEYPYLEKADFPAVYAYTAQTGRERKSR
jgi:hypothetical protein